MATALPFIMVMALAFVLLVPSGTANGQQDAPSDPPPQATGRQTDPAKPFLSAIKDARTSIVEQAPKCEQGTTLRGTLVLETPERPGFPLTATTIASPDGTFTTVTGTGAVSGVVIDEVGKVLNNRANDYVRQLLRNCSL